MVVDMDAEIPSCQSNLEIARAYLQALAQGAPPDTLGRFLHDDIVFEELPNRLVPNGRRADRAAMLAASQRGQQVLSSQCYDVQGAIADGDQLALEVAWTGTLAVPLGTLPVGYVMRARFAMFLELRDGRIISQRNYDCYDPW